MIIWNIIDKFKIKDINRLTMTSNIKTNPKEMSNFK
jgi:hypothetical protein